MVLTNFEFLISFSTDSISANLASTSDLMTPWYLSGPPSLSPSFTPISLIVSFIDLWKPITTNSFVALFCSSCRMKCNFLFRIYTSKGLILRAYRRGVVLLNLFRLHAILIDVDSSIAKSFRIVVLFKFIHSRPYINFERTSEV